MNEGSASSKELGKEIMARDCVEMGFCPLRCRLLGAVLSCRSSCAGSAQPRLFLASNDIKRGARPGQPFPQ